MKSNSPIVIDIPCDNLLLNDPPIQDPPPTQHQLWIQPHMARDERMLRDYALSNLDVVQSNITRSTITISNFGIKPTII